jgi:hypothetical protein
VGTTQRPSAKERRAAYAELLKADPADVLKQIDAARSGLFKLVRSADSRALTKSPSSGEWSAILNLRHLLFAEQLHLGRFVKDFEWNPVGFTNRTGKAYAGVGMKPTNDPEAVIKEWNAVHAQTRKAVKLGVHEEFRRQLAGNLMHLRQHVATIKDLLGELRG